MDITVTIPDELAALLGADLDRRVLAALAHEEFRAGRLSHPDLRRLLGIAAGTDVPAEFRASRRGKMLGGLDASSLIHEGRR